MKTAGIKTCKAGWLLISFDPGDSRYEILHDDSEFEGAFESCDRIWIDIPIGLNDEAFERQCDILLREKLGTDHADSIFTPPIRPVLDAPTYAEASMQLYELTGEKLSPNSWGMTPRIRKVDTLLRAKESWREKVFESHPELLFMQINGGRIFQSKKTKKGIRHRLGLVSGVIPEAKELFRSMKEEYRRNEVEETEMVDGLVLALAARKSADQPVKSLPESPETDSEGLRRAIHFV